jgi:hypothetical protein
MLEVNPNLALCLRVRRGGWWVKRVFGALPSIGGATVKDRISPLVTSQSASAEQSNRSTIQ